MTKTWASFEQALEEFNRKNNVDWTSRELQDNTARDIANRAFQIRANKLRNSRRRAIDQARKDCGLVRGKDSMGRVIWE